MTLSDADLEVIDQRVQAALSHLIEQLPNAIASGITTHAARPPSERGSPSLQFGVVEDSFPDQGFAQITLDGQINPIPVSMLGPLTVGERVAVLFYPPSGTLAIGQVSPVGIPGVSISNLPPAGTLTGGEDVPVDQSGTTVRTTTQDIADLATVAVAFPIGPQTIGSGVFEINAISGGGSSAMELTVEDTGSSTISQILILTNNTPNTSEIGIISALPGGSSVRGALQTEADASGGLGEATMAAENATGAVAQVLCQSNAADGAQILMTAGSGFSFTASSAAGAGINVQTSLPSSDPGVSGQLYEVAGVVMISP